MRRFITRHSQIPDGSAYDGGHLFPEGETLISELGYLQARYVGRALRDMNFKGVILSSPYVRTLLTAEVIAQETGAEIIPYAPVHEIFRKESQIQTYKGLTIEEIRATFKHISESATLAYPWWPSKIETQEDVNRRAAEGVRAAEELYGDGDILYVGHGASCEALALAHNIAIKRYPIMFNCSLSIFDDTGVKKKRTWCDTTHLPYDMTTSNFLKKRDLDNERMSAECTAEIKLPEWLESIKGERVLHIGDTESWNYPYFRKLIETVKPDVIIHTGDMADEAKAGRAPFAVDEYKNKLRVIAEILRASGTKRLIIVPGNNDIPSEIASRIPEAEIYEPNSAVVIDGVECKLSHSVKDLVPDRKWSFYGHGFTGDSWVYENNKSGAQCRFNACRGATICCPSEEIFELIEIPKIPMSIH